MADNWDDILAEPIASLADPTAATPSHGESAVEGTPGAWLAVHPLARGRGPRDEHPVFVGLGRFPGAQPPEPLSAQAVHKLVRACALAAGVPERLAHRTRFAPTGPRRFSKRACRSTASPPGLATPT